MIRFLFIVFLLFGFYGSAKVFGQDINATFYRVPARATIPIAAAPPQVLLVPQVQMVPFVYDRTEVIQRQYRTPLRDVLFGRYRINQFYSPQVTR